MYKVTRVKTNVVLIKRKIELHLDLSFVIKNSKIVGIKRKLVSLRSNLKPKKSDWKMCFTATSPMSLEKYVKNNSRKREKVMM